MQQGQRHLLRLRLRQLSWRLGQLQLHGHR
jgi:hypothetical protein